jgi:outer membrane protein assembly factor BamB
MQSNVAVHAGKVYLPYHGGILYQLAADTGKLLQTFQSQEPGDNMSQAGGAPLIVDQIAYFTTNNGSLFALDIATWKTKWKLRPSEGSWLSYGPATDGRRVFVTTRQGPDKKGESSILAIGRD